MTVVAVACLTALAAAAALCLGRMVRSRTLIDRAIALDTVTATVVGGLAVAMAWTGDGIYAEVALVLSLLGFLATVTIARFTGRRGA